MRILIVEDNQCLRRTVRDLLRGMGYEVRGARSYRKAVKRLTRHKFDLVLSDMEIGDGSGLDVLQLARQAHPEPCVVLMSGNPDPETVQTALESGAARFLSKPLTLGALLDAVKLAQNQMPADSDDTDQPSGTVSRF